jgi:hypothetical protein
MVTSPGSLAGDARQQPEHQVRLEEHAAAEDEREPREARRPGPPR